MDEVPLDEAVAKGLIPCAGCGAPGAAVKRVGGKPHFLCPACSRRARATAWVGGGIALLVLAGIAWWMLSKTPAGDVDRVLRRERPDQMLAALEAMAKEEPGNPRVLFELARLRFELGHTDGALEAFTRLVEVEPEAEATAGLFQGRCLQRLGRAAEALPKLSRPVSNPELEAIRQASLAECCLDLERYDEVLKLLEGAPPDGRRTWARYRALRYGGKEAEAEALLAKTSPGELWTFQVTRHREDGDFDAARRLLDERRRKAPEERLKLARSELAVAIEAGDLSRSLELSAELAASPELQLRAEALDLRATALLLGGDRDGARRLAEQFLAADDPRVSSVRRERLRMSFLTGASTAEQLEAEARRVSRFHANDLYWFLAAATGDKSWAEKGLAATPGRNFPYHALKRLAGK